MGKLYLGLNDDTPYEGERQLYLRLNNENNINKTIMEKL